MKPGNLTQRLPIAIAALLLVLLALLATLQWYWSGEVSDLERQRMRSSLLTAASRFSDDVDREVTRAFFLFRTEPGEPEDERIERVIRQYGRWQAEAPYPHMIREIFIVRPSAGGMGLEVLRPAEGRFETCSWPADLERVWPELKARTGPPRGAFGTMVSGEIPGLVIPLTLSRTPGPPETGSEPGAELVVQFDRDVMTGEIFPALTKRHFQTAEGIDYALAVLDGQQPDRVLYVSDPQVPAASFRKGDLSLGVFGVRPFEELRPLWEGAGRPRERFPRRGPREWREWEAERPPRPAPPGERPGERRHDSEAWRLVVKHRDGSLEEAVVAIRRRNLGISLGILVLLAATAGMMMMTTQRAQRLARQQIEFVAGVTHELHTPLTAIRSAGQNLADGVVADPTQVKRYGALIEGEGRRLSNMVGQALEFAGIQSGRRVYHPQPVAAEEIVAGALRDCRWLLQEKRVEVEKEIEPELPRLLADAAALRHAVANLLENAVKYGGSARWIGLRVRREPSGQIAIQVSDRGPGIRKEDLPHLFEPFFRSRSAATGGIPGSGLGLSLVRHIVEAQGGRVTVTTEVGKGTAFTLHLPIEEPG